MSVPCGAISFGGVAAPPVQDATDFRDALREAGIDYQPAQIMRVHNYFHVQG